MRVAAIDPGLSGALVLLDAERLSIADMPRVGPEVDPNAVARIVAGWGPVACVAIEKVHADRNWAKGACFQFGKGLGVLVGVLAALERPVRWVPPSTWTKAAGLPVGAPKAVHVRLAMERWPAQAHEFRGPRGGLLDGRADAALIAAWCADSLRTGMGV